MMKTKEELAQEFANSLENITDIKCPRDVINPGLWYGFMKGYEIAEDEYQEVTMWTPEELSQLLNTKDYLETKLEELKNNLKAEQSMYSKLQQENRNYKFEINRLEERINELEELIDEEY